MADVIPSESPKVLAVLLNCIRDGCVGFIDAGELALSTIGGGIDGLQVSLERLHSGIKGMDVCLELCNFSLITMGR